MVELTKYGRYHLLLLCEWVFDMRVMHYMQMYIYYLCLRLVYFQENITTLKNKLTPFFMRHLLSAPMDIFLVHEQFYL